MQFMCPPCPQRIQNNPAPRTGKRHKAHSRLKRLHASHHARPPSVAATVGTDVAQREQRVSSTHKRSSGTVGSVSGRASRAAAALLLLRVCAGCAVVLHLPIAIGVMCLHTWRERKKAVGGGPGQRADMDSSQVRERTRTSARASSIPQRSKTSA